MGNTDAEKNLIRAYIAVEAVHFVTWIFYVPAQVMLVLSYVEACTDAGQKRFRFCPFALLYGKMNVV